MKRTLLLGVLLLAASQGALRAQSAAPRHYANVLLDSVGLRFPGDGRQAQPIVNPFEYIDTTSQRHYPWRAISDAQGQMQFAYGFDRRYLRPAIFNRQGDTVSQSGALNTNVLAVPWPNRPGYTILIGPTKLLNSPNRNYSLNYAVLDHNARGGRGWIPDSARHLPLHDTTSYAAGGYHFAGNLLLAQHASGHGYWVLNRRPSGEVAAYRIDSTGIRLPAVISQLPARPRPTIATSTYDQMTLTLNQRRVLFGQAYRLRDDSLAIYDMEFDAVSGRLTRPRLLYAADTHSDSQLGLFQPAAISPQGRYAYCIVYPPGTQQRLYQYDLWAGPAAVVASRQLIHTKSPDIWLWGMAFTGPDGRIYLTRYRSDADVIDCPDLPGPACGYREQAVGLPDRSAAVADNWNHGSWAGGNGQFSFRNFYPTPYSDILPVGLVGDVSAPSQACVRQPVRFAVAQATAIDSIRWYFGDGTSAPGPSATHTYPQPGTYVVLGVYHYRCGQDTIRRPLTVSVPPARLLAPPDTGDCDQPTILRVRAPAGVTWQWADSAPADSVRRVTTGGTYALTWQFGGCRGREEVAVETPRVCPPLFIPNVVTPNADGRNDAFVVDVPGRWRLTIYTRWGREVWRSADSGYVGEWSGQGLADGLYFYRLEPLSGHRAATAVKGWVEVVR